MTKNKRFTDNGFEVIVDQSFTDNLTKKTYYVDYFDEIVDLCNSLWEQTQRFEKHNKDLMEDNGQLKQSNQKAIEFILDGVVEMHDGKRDYAETIFNKAIRLLKGDVE